MEEWSNSICWSLLSKSSMLLMDFLGACDLQMRRLFDSSLGGGWGKWQDERWTSPAEQRKWTVCLCVWSPSVWAAMSSGRVLNNRFSPDSSISFGSCAHALHTAQFLGCCVHLARLDSHCGRKTEMSKKQSIFSPISFETIYNIISSPFFNFNLINLVSLFFMSSFSTWCDASWQVA